MRKDGLQDAKMWTSLLTTRWSCGPCHKSSEDIELFILHAGEIADLICLHIIMFCLFSGWAGLTMWDDSNKRVLEQKTKQHKALILVSYLGLKSTIRTLTLKSWPQKPLGCPPKQITNHLCPSLCFNVFVICLTKAGPTWHHDIMTLWRAVCRSLSHSPFYSLKFSSLWHIACPFLFHQTERLLSWWRQRCLQGTKNLSETKDSFRTIRSNTSSWDGWRSYSTINQLHWKLKSTTISIVCPNIYHGNGFLCMVFMSHQ